MEGFMSISVDVFVWYIKLARLAVAFSSVAAAIVTFYAVVAALAIVFASLVSWTPLPVTVRRVFGTIPRQSPDQTSSLHRAICHTPRNRSLHGTLDCLC